MPHCGCGAPGRHQQAGGLRCLRALHQQRGQGRRFVAEQRSQSLAPPVDAVLAQPSRAVEVGLARGKIGFAQQPAGARGKAGVEEPLGPARRGPAEHGRGQGVHALDVGLGAQVFQIQPDWRFGVKWASSAGGACASSYEFRRNLAAEGFCPSPGWGAGRQRGHGLRILRAGPGQHLHAGHIALQRAGCHPVQRGRIVHPQPHALAARHQVARQAPAHAQIAMVVDHAAEDVPKGRVG